MKFTVERRTKRGRLGTIQEWGSHPTPVNLETPAYLTYTRMGHVPHLVHDVAQKLLKLKQKQILQITLSSVADVFDKELGNLAEFCCIDPDLVFHLSLHDPLGKVPSGLNTNEIAAIWTTSGKIPFKSTTYTDFITASGVHSFTTLYDYDTPPIDGTTTKKRCGKSLYRTVTWNDTSLVEKDSSTRRLPQASFAALSGGANKEQRIHIARVLAAKPYADGVMVDLLHYSLGSQIAGRVEFDKEIVGELVYDVLAVLPENRPRLVEGAFPPDVIRLLVRAGIDLFDSSYAVYLSDLGSALWINDSFAVDGSFEVIDFSTEAFKGDTSPVTSGCPCYTCKTFKKCYIAHLINTKELLASVLLTVHNMTQFDRMFDLLREDFRIGDDV